MMRVAKLFPLSDRNHCVAIVIEVGYVKIQSKTEEYSVTPGQNMFSLITNETCFTMKSVHIRRRIA